MPLTLLLLIILVPAGAFGLALGMGRLEERLLSAPVAADSTPRTVAPSSGRGGA